MTLFDRIGHERVAEVLADAVMGDRLRFHPLDGYGPRPAKAADQLELALWFELCALSIGRST